MRARAAAGRAPAHPFGAAANGNGDETLASLTPSGRRSRLTNAKESIRQEAAVLLQAHARARAARIVLVWMRANADLESMQRDVPAGVRATDARAPAHAYPPRGRSVVGGAVAPFPRAPALEARDRRRRSIALPPSPFSASPDRRRRSRSVATKPVLGIAAPDCSRRGLCVEVETQTRAGWTRLVSQAGSTTLGRPSVRAARWQLERLREG